MGSNERNHVRIMNKMMVGTSIPTMMNDNANDDYRFNNNRNTNDVAIMKVV